MAEIKLTRRRRRKLPENVIDFQVAERPPMGEEGFADPTRLFQGARAWAYNPGALVSRRGYTVIDEMRRDEQVKAAMAFKKHAVLAAGWTVKGPDGVSKEDPTVKLCLDALNGMRGGLDLQTGFEAALLEIMTAMDYGFSITERIWEERDGAIMYASLKTRKPHHWNFMQDEHGNLLGARQMDVDMPLDRFVIWAYEGEFSNPYGRPDLEAAYRAWWTKQNAYKWMAMLLERMGIPPIFALYNPAAFGQTSATQTSPQLEQLKTVLRRLQGATVGALPRPDPEALELWTPELAGQVSRVFIPAMERLDQDIARALLMPGLIGMTSDNEVGSMARAQVHFDVFMLVLERIRREITESVVNEQILRPLIDYNKSIPDPEKRPKFEFLPITDEVRKDIIDAWVALTTAKVVTPTDEDEEHAREVLKFPEFDPKMAEERSKRQAELGAENAKTQMEATGGVPQPGGKPPVPGGAPKKFSLDEEQFERFLETVAVATGLDRSIAAYAWDESDHPRHPSGSDSGGEFAPKGGGDKREEWIRSNKEASIRRIFDARLHREPTDSEIEAILGEYQRKSEGTMAMDLVRRILRGEMK